MTQRVIDQAASEIRLHRVHYFLKFLRALVLHQILLIAAVALFVLTDIKVYLVEDTIKAVRATIDQAQRQGAPIGQFFIVSVVLFMIPTILGFFVWMYLSITKVWRRALQIQSIVIVFGSLISILAAWPQLAFAFENLDPLFSVLALLSYILAIGLGLDIAVALWGVSRSPENSSFVATLDSRLTRGLWTYLNKLLDLPRRPFQSRRNSAAYALSLSGAIVLIISIFYLTTLGGVSNKLSQLVPACDSTNMVRCTAQSSAWAQEILVWTLLLLLGIPAATSMQSLAKRLGGLSVSDVLKSSDDRFVLYLRPFDADHVTLPQPRLPPLSRLFSFRPFPTRIEEELFDVSDGYRPLIAVAKPQSAETGTGGLAYRTHLDDTDWQEYVLDGIRRAESIVILLKDTDGVRWELSKVLSENAVQKTLFLFDPIGKDPNSWQTLANAILPEFEAAGLIAPGFAFQGQPIGFYFKSGELVEIENANWTTTSYRTAFSHFLAEHAV